MKKFLAMFAMIGAFFVGLFQSHASGTLTGAINGVAGGGTTMATDLLDGDLGTIIKLVVGLAILGLIVYAVKKFVKS